MAFDEFVACKTILRCDCSIRSFGFMVSRVEMVGLARGKGGNYAWKWGNLGRKGETLVSAVPFTQDCWKLTDTPLVDSYDLDRGLTI